MMLKKAMLLAALLLHAAPLAAYPLVDPQCKDDPKACVLAGTLVYVSIYGEIGYEDLAFFRMVDKYLPPDAPFPHVYLNSYGGLVRAGMGIGRILHKHDATAESGSPVILDPSPKCISACVLIAQGAPHRRLVHIGLHSSSVRVKLDENVWETQAGSMEDIMEYMTEMGAKEGAKKLMARTQFDDLMTFVFDPVQPKDNQLMYKLGFYDLDDTYFSKASNTDPDYFAFTSNEDYMINAANYGLVLSRFGAAPLIA